MIFDLGAMIGTFADAGTALQVVALSDGPRSGSAVGPWVGLSRMAVDLADELGVSELEILDHGLADLPRIGANTLAREVCGTVGRADAVMAALAPRTSKRASRITFDTAVRVAKIIGSPVFAWSRTAPRRLPFDGTTVAVDVPQRRHRAMVRRIAGGSDPAGIELPAQECLTISEPGLVSGELAR